MAKTPNTADVAALVAGSVAVALLVGGQMNHAVPNYMLLPGLLGASLALWPVIRRLREAMDARRLRPIPIRVEDRRRRGARK